MSRHRASIALALVAAWLPVVAARARQAIEPRAPAPRAVAPTSVAERGSTLALESHGGSVIFTPPEFDAARPFWIEIDLEAGASCELYDYVEVGAPKPQ